jgi:hypothetical protein
LRFVAPGECIDESVLQSRPPERPRRMAASGNMEHASLAVAGAASAASFHGPLHQALEKLAAETIPARTK